jgi:hypothetical protein
VRKNEFKIFRAVSILTAPAVFEKKFIEPGFVRLRQVCEMMATLELDREMGPEIPECTAFGTPSA